MELLTTNSPTILDIGCGNSSPTVTKRWIQKCEYHGVDIQHYVMSKSDYSAMNRFFLVTKELDGYEIIPNDYYDAVILNHVIEHAARPVDLLRVAVSKLKRGGVIYIGFPSERSLSLPSAQGTLNFSDDDTHIWFPDFNLIVNTLLSLNVRVLQGGRSKDIVRSLLGLLILPVAYTRKLFAGQLNARGLWYILGFEAFVVGLKK